MIAKWKLYSVWLIWLITWPILLWISYEHYYLNIEGQFLDILLFAVFMCIVALFPLTINNTSIFFINGISIAIFLTFGLFVEIILSFVAIIMVMAKLRVGKKGIYRIPLNILMFTVVSMLSAEVYSLLGGRNDLIHYQNEAELFAMTGYAISIFIFNQAIIKIVQRTFLGIKEKLFDKSLKWEFTSSLLIIPVGFVLYILYSEIGNAAIFFLSVPFISISIILKLLYSYQEINKYLKKTGEVGHRLAQKLEVSEVYDVFMREMVQLMPVDYAYIYITSNDKLKLVRYFDASNQLEVSHEYVKRDEAFSGRVFSSRTSILYKNSREWEDIKNPIIPEEAESVLSLPIEYGEEIIGVVTIVSKKEKAYDKTHHRIADILTNYLGVAIENAKHYELTKAESEKDGLTKLYNYRYLDKVLDEHFNVNDELLTSLHCSMLIVDLDHFKKVNDTYGHEAGNEILKETAVRLKEMIGTLGYVSRYGGEEFIIFLPDSDLTKALHVAEGIRLSIGGTSFTVYQHILPHSNPVEVNVTASIGVSSYPEHCEEPNELIRHADRAMYIGAKRMGRNKVAVYNHINEEAIL
ncbi:sensor domain-containing diguanylate cyclase [Ornithinibacillus halophilus]|uniref:Diguanylate cyclase with GAF sensor n=1 Tax=Ornithinibacillus halophilus TaxID=930117 RepID=A0A1M5DER6_9BACI|nr:sensor domain-containing diguanylate cyclase [Ornithinibacillus halophilus]SHF65172.1 diguanylate cyclase with GAF sensor [Ornithinibacillus halophilus]